MNSSQLEDTPPWEWPPDARDVLRNALRDEGADEADRVIAAELAGDLTVLDEELALALLSVLQSAGEREEVRGRAAIALGPVLEQADGSSTSMPACRPRCDAGSSRHPCALPGDGTRTPSVPRMPATLRSIG